MSRCKCIKDSLGELSTFCTAPMPLRFDRWPYWSLRDLLRLDTDWTLEALDEFDNSTVCDDLFATDQIARDEALRTIRDEGIDSLIGPPSGMHERVGRLMAHSCRCRVVARPNSGTGSRNANL